MTHWGVIWVLSMLLNPWAFCIATGLSLFGYSSKAQAVAWLVAAGVFTMGIIGAMHL